MQARYNTTSNDFQGDIDRIELLETVASLRKDVCTMSSDIKEILAENVKLKNEVTRLQSRQANPQTPISRAKNVKSDIDRLMQLHSLLSSRKSESLEESRPSFPPRNEVSHDSSFAKKMMMFMMMSELV